MKYKVVVWNDDDPETIEVGVRHFYADGESSCQACGHTAKLEPGACFDAAYKDGKAFGEMLSRCGSSEFIRGMVNILQDNGHLHQSKSAG